MTYLECPISTWNSVQAVKTNASNKPHDKLLDIDIPSVQIVFSNQSEAERAIRYCAEECLFKMCLSEIAGKNCNQVAAYVCDHYEVERTGISSYDDRDIQGIKFRNVEINSA